MGPARLILTCGLPGSGKTTLARRLAVQRSAVRLTKDEQLWASGASPWDPAANARVERDLWGDAQELLRLGRGVVLDFGLWTRAERDRLRLAARELGVPVELQFLDVDRDELWRRIEFRNAAPPWDAAPIARVDLDGWLQVFEAPDAAELAQFDPPPVALPDGLVVGVDLSVVPPAEGGRHKPIGLDPYPPCGYRPNGGLPAMVPRDSGAAPGPGLLG